MMNGYNWKSNLPDDMLRGFENHKIPLSLYVKKESEASTGEAPRPESDPHVSDNDGAKPEAQAVREGGG